MNRSIITAVIALVLVVPLKALVQPDSVPGPIDVTIEQQFPPLDDIINLPGADIPVYGLYSWYSYYQGANPWQDTVEAVGWRTVRVSSHAWQFPAESFMTNLADRRFEIMYTLNARAREEFGAFRDSLGAPHAGNDQLMVDDYVQYVDTMLTLYGPGGTFFDDHPGLQNNPIMYWEICNEPNLHYLLGAASWDSLGRQEIAELYAKILVQVYAHIRKNPQWDSVKVVAFSACGVSQNDLNWPKPGFIEFVFAADSMVAHSYDIMSNHPYVNSKPPDSENLTSPWYHYSIANSHHAYREIMARYGNADKPVWFTEIGWTRDVGANPPRSSAVSERIQAAYVCRLYVTAMRLGVERVHVMFLLDADGFNGGFFDNTDRSRYESADAVQTMIHLMPNPKLTGAICDGDSGYYAYRFLADHTTDFDRNVIMAWNVEGPDTVSIPNDAGTYAVFDMLGTEIVSLRYDAAPEIRVAVGPCPVYIMPGGTIGVNSPSAFGDGALAGAVAVNPRPFTDAVTLSFNLKKSAAVQLTVVNAAGEVMAQPLNGVTAAGAHAIALDELSVASSGVYMYIMQVDGRRVTGRFIKTE